MVVINIMTLINGLYQRTLNIQGVQHSLGSHEESLAHLDEALCLPELNHPQCEFDLESNLQRVFTCIPLQSRIFPFSEPR